MTDFSSQNLLFDSPSLNSEEALEQFLAVHACTSKKNVQDYLASDALEKRLMAHSHIRDLLAQWERQLNLGKKSLRQQKAFDPQPLEEPLQEIVQQIMSLYEPLPEALASLRPKFTPLYQCLQALEKHNAGAFGMISKSLAETLQGTKALLLPEWVAVCQLEAKLRQLAPLFFALQSQGKVYPEALTKRPFRGVQNTPRPEPKTGFPVHWGPQREPLNVWGLKISDAFSYEYCLKAGFFWLQKSVQTNFVDKSTLKKSLRAFYRALGVAPYRAGAYFGLGYIFALMQNKTRAEAFLKEAQKYASFEEISALEALLEAGL